MKNSLWGIDLGGTKIEGIILNGGSDSPPLCRIRIPTEADKGYPHILNRMELLLEKMKEASGIQPQKLGLGTPGTLDPQTNTIKNSNTTSLTGKPLQEDLSNQIGIPVSIANDANCFTLAEARFGAAKEAETVFGIILGTGVGGGIVSKGTTWKGLHGIAGEWGHNTLDPEGPECYCGKSGCVETFLSGPALEKHYYSLSGKKKPLREIAKVSDTDSAADNTIHRLITCFGKALAPVINILDPDMIVLGGGVSNIQSLYTKGPLEIQTRIFNDRLRTPIVQNSLGDSAGVYGAALLSD